MFVLIVGAGRVGSQVAKAALAAGHTVSVVDEDPLGGVAASVEPSTGAVASAGAPSAEPPTAAPA